LTTPAVPDDRKSSTEGSRNVAPHSGDLLKGNAEKQVYARMWPGGPEEYGRGVGDNAGEAGGFLAAKGGELPA
jgi:hypothetical protein